jgi:hypothetical protein
MLRITRTVSGPTTQYRLEGKLIGPWVDELATALSAEKTPIHNIDLHLTNVGFVDDAGAALLRSLLRRGVRIGEKSNYVAAILEVEQ